MIDKIWTVSLKKLVENRLLRLICVDEVHLFVHCWLSFCSKFMMLLLSLFEDIIIDKGSGYMFKIPVLFIMVTVLGGYLARYKS